MMLSTVSMLWSSGVRMMSNRVFTSTDLRISKLICVNADAFNIFEKDMPLQARWWPARSIQLVPHHANLPATPQRVHFFFGGFGALIQAAKKLDHLGPDTKDKVIYNDEGNIDCQLSDLQATSIPLRSDKSLQWLNHAQTQSLAYHELMTENMKNMGLIGTLVGNGRFFSYQSPTLVQEYLKKTYKNFERRHGLVERIYINSVKEKIPLAVTTTNFTTRVASVVGVMGDNQISIQIDPKKEIVGARLWEEIPSATSTSIWRCDISAQEFARRFFGHIDNIAPTTYPDGIHMTPLHTVQFAGAQTTERPTGGKVELYFRVTMKPRSGETVASTADFFQIEEKLDTLSYGKWSLVSYGTFLHKKSVLDAPIVFPLHGESGFLHGFEDKEYLLSGAPLTHFPHTELS